MAKLVFALQEVDKKCTKCGGELDIIEFDVQVSANHPSTHLDVAVSYEHENCCEVIGYMEVEV